jgi:hypothetical protein
VNVTIEAPALWTKPGAASFEAAFCVQGRTSHAASTLGPQDAKAKGDAMLLMPAGSFGNRVDRNNLQA